MNVSFEEFFGAIWGYAPYPWQTELSQRVHESGWPDVLDIPTGAGKTAVLDIALHHFIADGGVTAPRRMILVVDRRIIVDQVAERATEILDKLNSPDLRNVKSRLIELVGKDAPPLVTSVLRGGMVRDDAWAAYPHVPVLATSTVDQVGSRLLFRGYGLGSRMQPIHAGLLGCDTLLFLDEVHLAQPFAEVLAQLIALRSHASGKGESPPLNAVQLSATPGRSVSFTQARHGVYPDPDRPARDDATLDIFHISALDRANERLSRVLSASKPGTLEVVNVAARAQDATKRAAIAERAAREARGLINEGRIAVAVVVNRVDTARRVWTLLQNDDFDTELLTGRMRPFDQAVVIDRIARRVSADRERTGDEDPIVVVATQCIEAGANYDFDGMVTELASLDALRQRFGRLDRQGVVTAARQRNPETPGPRAIVLARSDLLGTGADPVYGDRLGVTWNWLNEIAVDGVVDFGIDALQPKLSALGDRVLTMVADAPPAPVLVPTYLDQWAQTNPRPHADPDVSLFLHGIPVDANRRTADVRVVWRADLTEELLQQSDDVLGDHLAATPPASAEAISLPVWTIKQWLAGAADSGDADVADVEGIAPGSDNEVAPDRRVLVWRGREESRSVAAAAIQPGDTIVVPVSYGGIGSHGTFDPRARPSENVRIIDLGDIVQLRQRGKASLRLHPLVLESILGKSFDVALPTGEDVEVDERSALNDVLELVVRAAAGDSAPAWLAEELLPALGEDPRFIRNPLLARLGIDRETWIAIGRANTAPRRSDVGGEVSIPAPVDEDDESFTGVSRPGTLNGHLGGVSSLAGDFASRVRLPQVVRVSLRWAGLLHDVGKADPRFQVLLYGGDEIAARFGDLLAKSDIPYQDTMRRRIARGIARYPRGQRHELVSVAMIQGSDELRARIEADGGDWDLVLHLVATHHGWGRSLAPFLDADDLDDPVEIVVDGMRLTSKTRHGMDRIDSGHTERFWRLTRAYGHHELAYYESILRLADHRYSAAEAMR